MTKIDNLQWKSDPARRQWKMIHLLYLYGKPGLHHKRLWDAGVDCEADAIDPLARSGVTSSDGSNFRLTDATLKILEICTLGYRGGRVGDFRVDHPSAFVVMPYCEPFETVYREAVKAALDTCCVKMTHTRADRTVRVGDLNDSVWAEIAGAGLVIADVTAPNPNVFYEVGLTVALGKDIFFLKDGAKDLPADFKGVHYYEYDLQNLARTRSELEAALTNWCKQRKAYEVAQLYGGAHEST
jgi:hypothetical protein